MITIALFGVALGEWWTTGAPQNYQCALQFVPTAILEDASAYTQIFINSLTAESPEFWGSAYGGSAYSSACATDLTTTLTQTNQVTMTLEGTNTDSLSSSALATTSSSAPTEATDSDLTTTLTQTNQVTVTLESPSTGSPVGSLAGSPSLSSSAAATTSAALPSSTQTVDASTETQAETSETVPATPTLASSSVVATITASPKMVCIIIE